MPLEFSVSKRDGSKGNLARTGRPIVTVWTPLQMEPLAERKPGRLPVPLPQLMEEKSVERVGRMSG